MKVLKELFHVVFKRVYPPVKSRDSAIGIATVHGLDGRELGVRVSVRARIFSSPLHPDRFWGPSSLVSNRYLGLLPLG
jgi:hypothetical protein